MWRPATPTPRLITTTSSDFVMPGTTNPFSLFKKSLRWLRGRQPPPVPPEAEAYLVIPPHTKSAGKRTLEALPYLALVVLDSSTHGPEML